MKNQYNPTTKTPPSDTIKELLEERGWTTKDFIDNISLSKSNAKLLLQDKILINAYIANELERLFSLTTFYWINRQRHYLSNKKRTLSKDFFKKYSQ